MTTTNAVPAREVPDMKFRRLDELEMFELLQAAYPGRFEGDDENAAFEAAMEFADELSGWEDVAELLGRVVMLTMPMEGALSSKFSHCLGVVKLLAGNEIGMTAAVQRDFEPIQAGTTTTSKGP